MESTPREAPIPVSAGASGAVFGRYRVERKLGAGSGGVVFIAVDLDSGARVALKTLHVASPDQIALLKNEFRAIQGLHHPNLVQIGELFHDAGQWFLSMEYIDGEDFLTHVRTRDGSFSESRLRSALRQLASALCALHSTRTVHRDIKPSNVMVTSEGRVVVLDFGLATRDDSISLRDQGMAGTVAYMPPEQVLATPIGPAADWYAVGAMLFETLTGVTPFTGDPQEVLERKVLEEAPSPLSIVPDLPADLVSLCEQLLRCEAEERPSDDDVVRRLGVADIGAAAAPSDHKIPLLGRQDELAWLHSAFEATRDGSPVAAILDGKSGVGKTMLLRAFTDRLLEEHPDLLILFSRCYERETVPFKAFDGAVEGLAAVLNELSDDILSPWLSEHAGILPRIFPELGLVRLLADRAETVTIEDPHQARRYGFDALRKLLVGLANVRPVMLVIDDLQWADADSFALLRALLDPPFAPPVLLLCTNRVGTGAELSVGHGGRKLPGEARTLALEKLDPTTAAQFVSDLLAHEGMPRRSDNEIASLVRESGGHPMFLAELVLQGGGDGRDVSYGRLDDALQARVLKLPSAAKRLLEAVCVAGIPIDHRVAADAASVSPRELMGMLPRLTVERFVQTWGALPRTRAEPYHDRVRESVVAMLSEESLRALHGRLAMSLERFDPTTDPEVLADHWLKSGTGDRAKAYIIRAAEKSKNGLAFDHAAAFYKQAIDLCSADDERCPLQNELADVLTNANRWREAAELRLELAKRSPPVVARALETVAAEQLLCSGRFDQGTLLLESVLGSVNAYVPRSPWTTIIALLLVRFRLALRGLKMRATGRPVSDQEAGRIDPLLAAGYGFAMTDSMLGSYFNTRALLRALDSGDPQRAARALFTEASYTSSGGRKSRKKTLKLIELLREVTKPLSAPLAEALQVGPEAYLDYFMLDWRGAKEKFLRAEKLFGEQCVGQFWAQNSMRTLAFRAMIQLGERDELSRRVSEALRETEQVGDLYGLANLRGGPLAWLRLVDDEVDLAEAELRHVEALLPKNRFVVQSYFHWVARVQLTLYQAGHEAAYLQVERSWPRLQRSLLLRVSLIRVHAWEMRGRALLASAIALSGNAREARLKAAESIARRLRSERYLSADGHASLLVAGVELARGHKVDALAAARLSEQCFAEAGMQLHVGVSRWLSGTLLAGSEGAALVDAGRAALVRAGVKNPEAFAELLAPAMMVFRS